MKFLKFFLIIFISLTTSIKADLNKNLINQLEDGEKLIFLQVARFVGKKGHEYTMQALHDFLKTQPDPSLFEFRLIGDGPLLDATQKQVEKLGLSDVVKFLGVKVLSASIRVYLDDDSTCVRSKIHSVFI